MPISTKEGVSLNRLSTRMLPVMAVMEEIMGEYGLDAIITSGSDSKHSENSLHYEGKALDWRTRQLPDERTKSVVRDKAAHRLGNDYDVVLEKDHIHIEYDPPGK